MLSTVRQLKPQLCLFAIAVCLTAWQFMLLGRITADSNRQVVDLMFWLAVLLLLWQKRQQLRLDSDRLSTSIGLLLLGFAFYKGLTLFWFESLPLRMIPVLAPLGLALLASGWRGLRQYWQEFIIFSLLLLPFDRLDRYLEFNTPFNKITAAFSSFLLHYVGFVVERSGAYLHLSGDRSVFVAYECTGGQIILLLAKLSLLFILVFPLTWRWRVLMLAIPTALGFVIGGIRVSLLALVVNNESRFQYWHGDPGNQIFSMASMVLYGILCYYVHEHVVLPLETKLAAARSAARSEVPSVPAVAGIAPDGTAVAVPPTARPPVAAPASVPASPDRQFQRPLLVAVWGASLVLTAYTLAVPTAGSRSLPPITLPERLELAATYWSLQSGNALPVHTELTEERFERVRSARRYTYQGPEGDRATVDLRYVTGSLGNIDGLLYAQDIDADSVGHSQARQLPGVGSYRLFTFADRAYLTSCLNARGQSTINPGEFLANRQQHDPPLARIGPWLLGRQSLRDRRCLWVLISMPHPAGIDPAAKYQQLEGLWQAGHPQWQAEIAREP